MLQKKREQRYGLVKQARALLDKADAEKRDMSAEEVSQYEAIMADVDKIADEIKLAESSGAMRSRVDQLMSELERTESRQAIVPAGVTTKPTETPEQRTTRALRAFIRGETRETEFALRSLQADSAEAGGYITKPQQFMAELIKAMDDMTVIRQRARVIPTNGAESLGIPTLDANPTEPTWGTELTIGSEDSAMDFGKRELKPHPLSAFIKVSNKLIRNAALDPEAIVRDRFAYVFGQAEDKAFLTGSGAGQPLGLFTASNDGIGTARDVSTGNTATAIVADNLIEVLYTLKDQYRSQAEWLFHRDAIKKIRQLKDGNGQYLWAPGLAGGQPDTILDRPLVSCENVPNVFTTQLYVGLLGVFSYYWIADDQSFQLQRLNELYAATNQVGFIGRLEVDGAPVLAEAFVRVKLA